MIDLRLTMERRELWQLIQDQHPEQAQFIKDMAGAFTGAKLGHYWVKRLPETPPQKKIAKIGL